jgi:hypothetical protein
MERPCTAILNKQKRLFSKMENRNMKQLLSGVGSSGRREDGRKGFRRMNVVNYYILVNENGKMRHVETIPGIGGGEIKGNDGGNEFNYDTL